MPRAGYMITRNSATLCCFCTVVAGLIPQWFEQRDYFSYRNSNSLAHNVHDVRDLHVRWREHFSTEGRPTWSTGTTIPDDMSVAEVAETYKIDLPAAMSVPSGRGSGQPGAGGTLEDTVAFL